MEALLKFDDYKIGIIDSYWKRIRDDYNVEEPVYLNERLYLTLKGNEPEEDIKLMVIDFKSGKTHLLVPASGPRDAVLGARVDTCSIVPFASSTDITSAFITASIVQPGGTTFGIFEVIFDFDEDLYYRGALIQHFEVEFLQLCCISSGKYVITRRADNPNYIVNKIEIGRAGYKTKEMCQFVDSRNLEFNVFSDYLIMANMNLKHLIVRHLLTGREILCFSFTNVTFIGGILSASDKNGGGDKLIFIHDSKPTLKFVDLQTKNIYSRPIPKYFYVFPSLMALSDKNLIIASAHDENSHSWPINKPHKLLFLVKRRCPTPWFNIKWHVLNEFANVMVQVNNYVKRRGQT